MPGVILNGNTFIAAAITEMLLQSQTGIIDLLPALPTEFKQGSVKGLCARGGFVVDIDWKNHQLATAVLHARQSHHVKSNYNLIIKYI